MRDYLNIGPAPAEEDCAQVGHDDYIPRARRECTAFIDQIRRTVGQPPEGAFLQSKRFPHDLGSYLEVVVVYDDDKEEAVEYAFRCESEAPSRWDDTARAFLVSFLI